MSQAHIVFHDDLFDELHTAKSGASDEVNTKAINAPMNKQMKNRSLLGTGALGVAALTLGFAGVAGAQDAPVVEDPAPIEQLDDTNDRASRSDRRQARIEARQAQADTGERSEAREARKAERQAAKAEKVAEIAEVVGISADELTDAKAAGSSLAEIAGDELPAVVSYFVDNATERIDAKVADGTITQEQADAKLEGLEERIETRLADGGGFGKKKGEGKRGKGNRAGAQETTDA